MPSLYQERHTGCAIVVGGASRVHEDLAAARKLRPNAVLLGAAFIGAVIKEVRMVWTQHADDAPQIKATADVLVHSRPKDGIDDSGCDYLWPDLKWVGASSGFAAGLWARHGLGFDEVILAGVPLSPEVNTSVEGYPTAVPDWAPYAAFTSWHNQIRGFTARGKTDGIKSMSGATRVLLGKPEALDGVG